MKKSFFTTFIFLWSAVFLSLQAQDCGAPPAPSVNWSGCDKSGVNLFNANLAGANLSGAILYQTNLNDANLSDANLSGASVVQAFLQGANLTGANLTGANMGVANLDNADLSNANLTGADLLNASLPGANLSGANLSSTQLSGTNMSGAILTGATLTGAQITSSNLAGVNMAGANLSGLGIYDVYASLYNSDLTGANLTGADLTNMDLRNINISGADLTGAILTGVGSGGITGTPSALPANWQLINGYLVGPGANLSNANLASANLIYANLIGANLSGANLSGADLYGVNLSGANLTNANLTGARLSYANLTGANLTNANLSGADLSFANLSNANLSGANLTDATLSQLLSSGITGTPSALPADWQLINGYLVGPSANLANANLANMNLVGVNISGANLSGANLSGANLSGANLMQTNLNDANLSDANLSGATVVFTFLQGANLTSANLTGANMGGANLDNADLSNADLTSANLLSASLPGANLSGANLSDTQLSGTNMSGAILTGAILTGAQITSSNLSGANLSGANLSGLGIYDVYASLYNSDLTGANLTGANLTNMDLRNINISGADLTGAILNGVGSGGITGTPYALPTDWQLINGYLVGPLTVTFDANGGTTPSPTTITVLYNATYGTLATASRPCYAFNGWFTESIGGSQITSESTVAITSNQTLYAQWTAINYNYTETIAACGSYNWHGTTYTSSNTTATWTGTNAAGCDSTVTLNLTITSSPTITASSNSPVCEGGALNLTSTGVVTQPVAGNYSVESIAYAPVTPETAASAGPAGDEVVSGAIPIGFNFTYYGTTYTNVYISTNGFISFDPNTDAGCCSGQILPIGFNPNAVIALDWMDLNTANGGTIDYFNLESPSRFVVRFNNVATYSVTGTVSGEIILYPSGSIEIHNTAITTTALYQTQGIENPTGTLATTVAMRNRAAWNATADAFRFSPPIATGETSYAWTGPNAFSVQNPSIASASPTDSGTYTVTFTDPFGCTASTTVDAVVNPASSTTETIVACSSLDWHGNTYTSSNNTATWTGTNAAGCDSIVTLNLTINQPSYYTETIVACGSYEWHGTTYTSSTNNTGGIFGAGAGNLPTWTGTNAAGCDSIVSLDLTITPFTVNTTTIAACDSYTWPVNGQTYTASGTHIVNAGETVFFNSLSGLTSAVSAAGYTLSATETFESYSPGLEGPLTGNFGTVLPTWTASAPYGLFTSPSGGSMTISTNYPGQPVTIAFSAGVTSVGANFFVTNQGFATVSGTITLTLSDGSSQSFYTTTANSFGGFVSHGAFISSITIATSNDFVTVDNLVVSTGTINACISEELNLTINHPSTSTEPIVACGSYEWHGNTYTSSNNTATWTGQNAAGCDSIVTLNLTINSAPTATITGNTTFCAGGNTELTANATSGGGGSVMATEAGAGHSLFLKNDGTVWATGNNNYGQLGDGTNMDKNTPVQLSGLNGITAMAGGALHSLFLQNDGTVWATGLNNYGQLGDGTNVNKNTPVQVSGLSGISAIIAGDFHSLFLKNDGTVWATGANQIGQFGDGTYVSTNIPVQVSGLSGITAMAGGSVHSLFLKNDGTVWASGYNGEGQLGDGTYVYKNTPVQVSGLSGITAIAARASHSLFLKSDGTLWATGYNEFGQLGDGTNVSKNTPVQVSGLSGITAMAAGSVHSLFLMNDGTLWATGFNNYGQLGDGTYELKNTPVQVSGLSGTTAIAAGYNHSLFLKNDGTVRATGRNNVGQLGDVTYESKNTPVPVSGFDVTITSYQWKLNGSEIAGATNATYTATAAGNYTVEVTNSNGCSTSDSVTVVVNDPSYTTETIVACGSYNWHGTTYTSSTNNTGGIFGAGAGNLPTWTGTNTAGCDSIVSLDLTIQNPSTAPTSITSSVASASAGVNFTLSVNGGSLGTGATWNWYTGSCGGTLIGTGPSISVSQIANTTYFVRAEGTCNTTDCSTITVESFCGATGVTSSAGTTAICAGSPVTLTVIGSLSPGAQWRWDDECDNDDDDDDCSYNTSSTFTVSPNSTKTYYVRSVGGACGLTACVPVTVNVIPKPATPGTISGSASVCPSTSVTYTIAAVSGATSYTWTAPTNATLVSAQGGTSMTVAYAGTFTSGTLKVKANNCSGSSSDRTKSIAKQAAPATPASISGAAAPCKNSTQTYSIAAVSGATSYTWTLPTGVSFVSGTPQTGTSIQVVVANTFSSGTLSVKANNCGGSSSNRTKALTGQSAPTAPGSITGPSSVTQNTANNTFSVSNVAGMTYNWTVPAGCTITLGQGTSTIKVTWGTVAGTVSVTRNNGCGNSVASTKSVSVRRSEDAEANAGIESARTEETVETLLTATDALNAIAVYPNPTSGEARITFSTNASGTYAISIVDLQGRVINSTSGAAIEGNNTLDINLSNCSNGVYMIHLMHNDTLQTLRVVKM